MSVGSNPAFPTIYYDANSYVISHVNIAISRKLLSTQIIYSRRVIQIVRALQKLGCIKNYFVYKNKYKFIKFSPLFYKGRPYFTSIRLISTSSKKFYISINALRKLNKSVKASVYLLSTSRGIIPHTQALEYSIGGILLCTVG